MGILLEWTRIALLDTIQNATPALFSIDGPGSIVVVVFFWLAGGWFRPNKYLAAAADLTHVSRRNGETMLKLESIDPEKKLFRSSMV